MKSNAPTLTVIISIIFCGILAFALSLLHINYALKVREDPIALFLSDSTHYKEGLNGQYDTLMVGNQQAYRAYIRLLDSLPHIHLLDTAAQDSHKLIFAAYFGAPEAQDTLKPSLSRPYFFTHSTYLLNRQYFSTDSAGLFNTIASRDSVLKSQFAPVETEGAYFINRHPNLIIWMLMMSIVTGFSYCMAPLFIAGIFKHGRGVPRPVLLTAIGSSLLIILVLIAPAIVAELLDKVSLVKPTDMANIFGVGFAETNLMIQSNVPFFGPLCWLVLVVIICYQVTQLKGFQEEETLNTYENLHRDFEYSFTLIALFLAFALLTTNTLFQSLNEIINAPDQAFFLPPEVTFINGIMQTFFLGLIYFAVNLVFSGAKASLLSAQGDDVIESHQLNKPKTPLDYLKLALTILAPILGSGIQELFKLITG
ncbi:MAG: hypothetical protein AAFR61_20940 [Bacteroidota bacterium]